MLREMSRILSYSLPSYSFFPLRHLVVCPPGSALGGDGILNRLPTVSLRDGATKNVVDAWHPGVPPPSPSSLSLSLPRLPLPASLDSRRASRVTAPRIPAPHALSSARALARPPLCVIAFTFSSSSASRREPGASRVRRSAPAFSGAPRCPSPGARARAARREGGRAGQDERREETEDCHGAR